MKAFLAIVGMILITSVYAQKTDTLQVFQFSKAQEASWDSIQETWNKTYFQPFLKKNKIKITCAHCTKVFAVMALNIDSSGICTPVLIRGKVCSREYTKKELAELEKSLLKIRFPHEFYNTILKLYLGRVLSC